MIGELVRDLVQRGCRLDLRDGSVVVKAPKGAISAEVKRLLDESKPELIAALTERESNSAPDRPCAVCGRCAFWRGRSSRWRCIGCCGPDAWSEVVAMVVLAEDPSEPQGVLEAARAGAIGLLNEVGARLFERKGKAVVAIPREADVPEVRAAVECIGLKRVVFLDDPMVSERLRGAPVLTG